ncbi:hypothetical protein [uncultured Aquimarina sp.]|uniref:hypothetical protein n=1 Tax=uncultured Aquimarina sp. TaxID=575652 RepID=UPI00260252D6|nr:hypothetical protein [uncultured Aquimarina sp.]
MKSKIILFLLLNFVLSSCKFDDSFDEKLLADFKVFQEIIDENPDKIKGLNFDIADSYRWIVESNFNRLFSFANENFKNRFIELFDNKLITRIEVNNKKCIQFRIRPDYNNSLLKSEWNELWIVYNPGCDCVCHKKINGYEVSNDNIKQIEKNWFKVISKNKRYIGG